MNNEELINALRYCGNSLKTGCEGCPLWSKPMDACFQIVTIAADALEAAEKRIAELETALAACRARGGRMSEVIVRMEMPTGCAKCPMEDDDARFCKAAKEYIPMLGRPSWCPIIGVLPDEHGDLIDADAIYERAGQKKGEADPLALARELWSAPVIIAAERKDDGTTAD